MNLQLALSILLGVAVLVFAVYRQLRTRRVSGANWKLIAIMVALGVWQAYTFLHDVHAPIQIGSIVAVAVSLVVAALMAVPRAASMRIWRAEDGTWMTGGTFLTVLAWLATVGSHLLIAWFVPRLFGEHGAVFGGLEQATIMFYIATTIGIQGALRNRRIPAEVVVAA